MSLFIENLSCTSFYRNLTKLSTHLPIQENTYLNRLWQACPSGTTLLKATLLGLTILAASQLPSAQATIIQGNHVKQHGLPGDCFLAPRDLSSIPDQSCPVSFYDLAFPDCPHGFHKLSTSLANYMNTEMVLVGDGGAGCKLEGNMDWIQGCTKLVKLAETEVRKSKKQTEYVFNEIGFAENGTPVTRLLDSNAKRLLDLDQTSPLKNLTAVLGQNPKKMAQYQKAAEKVDAFFLSEKLWYEHTEKQMLTFIKDLHRTINENVFSQNPLEVLRPGKYRVDDVVVKHDATLDMENVVMFLENKGATPSEIEFYITSLQKAASGPLGFRSLNKKERAAMKMTFFMPPNHEQVASLMKQFAISLKQKASQHIHPFELAAWAHCEIGRIHPFSDGNGRISRLIMNGILAHYGYRPLAIPSESEYTKAVNADEDTPGTFARYLAEQVIPWNKQQEEYLGLFDNGKTVKIEL